MRGLVPARVFSIMGACVGGALLATTAAMWGALLVMSARRKRITLEDRADTAGRPHRPASEPQLPPEEGGADAGFVQDADDALELEDLAVMAPGRPGADSWGQGEVRQPVKGPRSTARRPGAQPRSAGAGPDGAAAGGACSSHLPGRQQVYVKTYGCAHNSSDSEFMMGLLRDYGYELVGQLEDASVCIINSCTVKSPSQDSATNLVRRAQDKGKAVVLAGCVPSADASIASSFREVSMLDVTQIDRVIEVVEEAIQGHVVHLLEKRRALPSLDLPKVRKNSFVEIIPINSGCLGHCSYCMTKHARGKLNSYSEDAIVGRALKAAAEGASEVWLTSEDTGAYGLDAGTNIASLLSRIARTLPPRVMLKLGMTNPPYMLAHMEAVARVLQLPNVFEFIHIPVQSGSDRVLRAMVREYTVGDFRRLVAGLRAVVPDILVATDMICGFPAESEEDHQASLELIREYHFPVLNISQFYPRPGTPAARMRKLPGNVTKQRSTEMTRLFESYQTYQALVGRDERAWFSETDTRHGQTVGHTKGYCKVVVDRDDTLLGRSAMVRISGACKWHVDAQVIGEVF